MDPLLKPAEVANLFGVSPKTIARWAKAGRLPCIQMPTGHRRYKTSDVKRLYETGEMTSEDSDA
jgi:excisionase family DNA binding protein